VALNNTVEQLKH